MADFKRNSDIVALNGPEYYLNKKADLNGYIDLEVTAIDDLYIGSGFVNYSNKGNYYETIKYDNKPIIPGSSLKGCIRHIANIVSDGCVADVNTLFKNKKYKNKYRFELREIRCSTSNMCIICDMFGMKGRKSKVIFSDLVSDNAQLKKINLNTQFSPGVGNEFYHDNKTLRGYKLYKTECEHYKGKSTNFVEVVKSGAIFKGKIIYYDLTETELNLLCYSLGLGAHFNPKIGGYKNDGLGQVKIRGTLFVNGKIVNACDYANAYKNYCYERNISDALDKVEEILKSTEV